MPRPGYPGRLDEEQGAAAHRPAEPDGDAGPARTGDDLDIERFGRGEHRDEGLRGASTGASSPSARRRTTRAQTVPSAPASSQTPASRV